MKKKKGISTIIGTLIFLQIIAVSVLLFLYVINMETLKTTSTMEAFDNETQHALLLESYSNNQTYLVVTSPVVITHVIYPNGTATNTSIVVKYSIPATKILGKEKWAVIVTNEGTWYNISVLNITTITLKPP